MFIIIIYAAAVVEIITEREREENAWKCS